jgi:Inner membrane component of T3SS, cytoplasmic domain
MPKFCNNGHQLEDAWSDCPYCARTGYRSASVGTMGKTRAETAATQAELAPPAFDPRKTVPLSTIKRTPVVGWVVVMDGVQKGEDFRLREGKNAVGSAEGCEVILREPAVSSKHASISYRDGQFVITDLDSTNGTFLNSATEPLARSELKDNDLIRIGDTTLKFKCL